jgi:hypothetical protein
MSRTPLDRLDCRNDRLQIQLFIVLPEWTLLSSETVLRGAR